MNATAPIFSGPHLHLISNIGNIWSVSIRAYVPINTTINFTFNFRYDISSQDNDFNADEYSSPKSSSSLFGKLLSPRGTDRSSEYSPPPTITHSIRNVMNNNITLIPNMRVVTQIVNISQDEHYNIICEYSLNDSHHDFVVPSQKMFLTYLYWSGTNFTDTTNTTNSLQNVHCILHHHHRSPYRKPYHFMINGGNHIYTTSSLWSYEDDYFRKLIETHDRVSLNTKLDAFINSCIVVDEGEEKDENSTIKNIHNRILDVGIDDDIIQILRTTIKFFKGMYLKYFSLPRRSTAGLIRRHKKDDDNEDNLSDAVKLGGVVGELYASIPFISVFDDEEIFKGFGSYDENVQSHPLIKRIIFPVARYFFDVFFLHRKIEHCLDVFKYFLSGDILPPPSESLISTTWQLAVGCIHFIHVDTRTFRTVSRILPEGYINTNVVPLLRRIIKARNGSIKHIIFLFPSPLLMPSQEEALSKIKSMLSLDDEKYKDVVSLLPHYKYPLRFKNCPFASIYRGRNNLGGAAAASSSTMVMMRSNELMEITNSSSEDDDDDDDDIGASSSSKKIKKVIVKPLVRGGEVESESEYFNDSWCNSNHRVEMVEMLNFLLHLGDDLHRDVTTSSMSSPSVTATTIRISIFSGSTNYGNICSMSNVLSKSIELNHEFVYQITSSGVFSSPDNHRYYNLLTTIFGSNFDRIIWGNNMLVKMHSWKELTHEIGKYFVTRPNFLTVQNGVQKELIVALHSLCYYRPPNETTLKNITDYVLTIPAVEKVQKKRK